VGSGPFDSIKWALETHMKEHDTGEFNYAVLHGNEDAPLKIQLWRNPEPKWDEKPDREWTPEAVTHATVVPEAAAGSWLAFITTGWQCRICGNIWTHKAVALEHVPAGKECARYAQIVRESNRRGKPDPEVTGTRANNGTVVSDADPGL
jgi:hypothetical protein